MLAVYFVASFCVCVVLSAIDIRDRDQRAHIFQVVAARPISNVAMYLGRLLGVVAVFAVPMLAFLCSVVLYGSVCEWVGFSYGEPVEFWSVVSIALLDVGPNLFFVGSLVVLGTTILRFRLAAAGIVLLVIFIGMWLHFRFPHTVTAPFQTITANVLFPSELAPQFLSVGVVVNRLALLLIGLGCVCLASSLIPRVTMWRSLNILSGVGLVFLGLLLVGGHFSATMLDKQRLKQWAATHQEPSPAAFPDIVHLSGFVDIRPGNLIELDLAIIVAPPPANPSNWVCFSLNPGYRIKSISIHGQALHQPEDYQFRDGLLKVSKLRFDKDLATLNIKARGRPILLFAYLDTSENLYQIEGPATRRLYHLGTANSIFHPRYFALLAEMKWYPTAGSAWQESNRDTRPRDFFNADITVSAPRNWTVAGPGHRVELNGDGRSVFQFAPKIPIPEITLIGSNFVRHSITVEDTEYEILVSPKHQRILRTLKPLADNHRLESWIKKNSKIIHEQFGLGIQYPHSMISIVEVPSRLRTYGSSWQVNSVLSAPGIIMLRETGLPTTRLKSWSDNMYQKSASEEWHLDAQIISFLTRQIDSYFAFDMQGESPSFGIVKQLFTFQTSPTGPGATVLEQVLEQSFVNRLEVFAPPIFSFWECMEPAYAELFTLNNLWSRRTNYMELQKMFFSQTEISPAPSVWEFLEQHSLLDLQAINDPRLPQEILRIKVPQFPLSLELTQQPDGTNITATLESDLLERYRGTTFSMEEFLKVATLENVELKESILAWLNTRGLPGYQIGAPEVVIRTDRETGTITYDNSFKIRNTEPAAGSIIVAWDISPETNPDSTQPQYAYNSFDLDGVQSYLITRRSTVPLERVWVKTGSSLNRDSLLRLDFIGALETSGEPEKAPPLISTTEWVLPVLQGIIVDDLDPGFSIVRHEEKPLFHRALQFAQKLFLRPNSDPDLELPVMQYVMQEELTTNHEWVREYGQLGFGRYRNTYAQFVPGSISLRQAKEERRNERIRDVRLQQRIASARFSTEIPKRGSWQLSYHLPIEKVLKHVVQYPFSTFQNFGLSGPQLYLPHLDLDTISLEIHSGTDIYSAEFDYSIAQSGWNVIGIYELEPKTVDVYISNVTNGEIVIADAIRWLNTSIAE